MQDNRPSVFRERVATFLALLSCEESRRVLSRWIDPDRLAFELCRSWFDDVYVPGIRYFDGLKGDYSEDAARRFREEFDDVEFAALERFHRFFELRLDMLRRQIIRKDRFPDTDLWRNLVKDAAYLLEDLDPHAVDRRTRLRNRLAARDGITVKRLLLGPRAT